MVEYGRSLKPLFKPVKYIATAHSSSTADFREEYDEAEDVED